MDLQEHLLIISAGDHIHKTYPAVLRDLRTVTHTFIFAEKEVFTNSARDDTQKRIWKCAIRDAIDEVNTHSLSRNISCALVCIDATTFDAIRDPVLGIFSDHPDAHYSFDISAGSKRLSMGLFSMSLWVDGEAYYAFGNSPARRVPVPTLPARNLPSNPHYLLILSILYRGQERGKDVKTLVPEETLFNEMKVWQLPVRHTDGRPPGPELTPAEFSRMISALTAWNLIRKEGDSGSEREKLYSITPEGELALIVYAARIKKRDGAGIPGLT
jgi:hypothetical protein